MNSKGTQFDIPVPVVPRINALHAAIRDALELDGPWRVQSIKEHNETSYAATKDSRTHLSPEYIHTYTDASFDVELIENAALDRIIEGETVAIHLPRLHIKLVLQSTGKLMIVHSEIETYTGRT